MYRIAFSSLRDQVRPYYNVNDGMVTVLADSVSGEAPVRLAGPADIVPGQRQAGGNLMLELPRVAMEAGVYAVLRAKDTLSLVALNPERNESATELTEPGELTGQIAGLPGVTVFDAGTQQAFSNGIKERYLGVPLWKYCLVLALLFLFAEVLLLRFWKV